ncbi:hypothetical protein GALMADRAFT_39149, partial [Galerina marginata CBS 339.88]
DGHSSHETPAMQRAAFEHNIILLAFPSKTTHKTQPLDVGVFGTVQKSWGSLCDRRITEGVPMTRFNVIHEYITLRHLVTPELIKTAFRKTGIYPLD